MNAKAGKELTITLPEAVADDISRAVASGDYSSPEVVVEAALEMWSERRRSEFLRRLRAAYDEGVASGPGRKVDPRGFLASLKAERYRDA
jgi:antitoxin ParD1/3/4